MFAHFLQHYSGKARRFFYRLPDPEKFSYQIPRVSCVSAGGPLDDKSFIAGMQYACVAIPLATGGCVCGVRVFSELLPHLDLLSLAAGRTMFAAAVPGDPSLSDVLICTENRLPTPSDFLISASEA